MNNKKVRIKDIAKLAGVSVGTVDRVLHNRGKVSEEALKKVLATLKQIDYKPNLIARSLGSNKSYRIAALIPDPSLDDYWQQSVWGIEQAEAEWSQYDFHIKPYYFNLYDKSSFQRISQAALNDQPDGVLLAPIFYQETIPYFKQLTAAGIPYVLFNTNISDASPLSFIGQNLYESGKVGAELLQMGQEPAGTYAILHINEDSQNSIHLMEKEKGFKSYFKERNSGTSVKSLDLSNHNGKAIQKEIGALISNTDLKGILVTTSKTVSLVATELEKQNNNKVRLVGYDLLESNVHSLRSGGIDFLINQNPKRQAALGISYLAKYLLFKIKPPKTDLFPLEIITKQNLDSYLNSAIH